MCTLCSRDDGRNKYLNFVSSGEEERKSMMVQENWASSSFPFADIAFSRDGEMVSFHIFRLEKVISSSFSQYIIFFLDL